MFAYAYRIAFYDTDAMGVVHHSNYARILEAARVAWMRELEIMSFHIPIGPNVLGVTKLSLEFLKPCRFEDEIVVYLEGKLEGVRLKIRYALWLDRARDFVAVGETELVPLVASTLKPTRFPMALRENFRKQPWSFTWPPVVL